MQVQSETMSAWFNYRTGEYDYHANTPENLQDYIPQSLAAQNMFSLLVNQKAMKPLEAAAKVLSSVIGDKDKAQ